ncbi:hypothetical protein PSPO01_11963 [Paraphaeosphaeria sporulosa]
MEGSSIHTPCTEQLGVPAAIRAIAALEVNALACGTDGLHKDPASRHPISGSETRRSAHGLSSALWERGANGGLEARAVARGVASHITGLGVVTAPQGKRIPRTKALGGQGVGEWCGWVEDGVE